MARSRTQARWSTLAVFLISTLFLAGITTAFAQETPPAALTKACQIGDLAVATEHPLPNVTAALKGSKVLRILAIGASASRRRAGSYVAQIEKLLEQANKGLDVIVINRGVSGELAADAAIRIKNEVALSEPNLVLWQIGTNDALAYVPLERIEATVTNTVRWLKAHKVDVVLVGLQFVQPMAQDEHYNAVRALLRKVAAQENVIIIRRYEAMELIAQAERVASDSLADDLHHIEGGYECLAQYVARAITLGVFGKTLREPAQQPATPR